jgi:quercetin dioxygenase-like cupin family protein
MSSDRIWELLASGLESVQPEPSARVRLLAEVEGLGRYLPLSTDLSRHFDLSRHDVRVVLSRIHDGSGWDPGTGPVLGFFHFRPGPRHSRLHAGIVSLRRGARIREHRHRDRELTYVLEGTVFDDKGIRYEPGAAIDMLPGSSHSLWIGDEADALVALLGEKSELHADASSDVGPPGEDGSP